MLQPVWKVVWLWMAEWSPHLEVIGVIGVIGGVFSVLRALQSFTLDFSLEDGGRLIQHRHPSGEPLLLPPTLLPCQGAC